VGQKVKGKKKETRGPLKKTSYKNYYINSKGDGMRKWRPGTDGRGG